MAKLNYNALLDLTLEVLLQETPHNFIEYNAIFIKNDTLNHLSNRDRFAIMQKLVNDGYSKPVEPEIDGFKNYYITLEGIIFFDNGKGGYLKQKKDKIKLQNWNYFKNSVLIVGSVSAFILALLQINEICHPKSANKERQTHIRTTKCQNNINKIECCIKSSEHHRKK